MCKSLPNVAAAHWKYVSAVVVRIGCDAYLVVHVGKASRLDGEECMENTTMGSRPKLLVSKLER